MKTLITSLFAILMLFALTNCGSDAGLDIAADENIEDEIEVTEDVEVDNTLYPSDVDINQPIPVGKLNEAFFAWEGKEVTVIGYCDIMFSYGSVKNEVKLVCNPDSSTQLVFCELLADYEGEKVEQTTTIVVKGKIDGTRFDAVSLKECEIVSSNM